MEGVKERKREFGWESDVEVLLEGEEERSAHEKQSQLHL